jgi:hypothetical protein
MPDSFTIRAMKGFVTVLAAVLSSIGIGVGVEAAINPVTVSVRAQALSHFVGYTLTGSAQSMSAKFFVPKILEGPESHASTWIGLESPSNAFIQIGVLEDKFSPDLPAYYAGFWSDDTVGFRPQLILPKSLTQAAIRPGDLIAVSIAAVNGGWRLHFFDAQDRLSFDRTVDMVNTGFNSAQWLQEDPTNANSLEPLPYPRLSGIRFTNLKFNGDSPRLGYRDESWMSLPELDFAPTPISDDSFSIERVYFTAAQAEFLNASTPYEVAANRFDDVENMWRTHPPSRVNALDTLRPFLLAEQRYNQVLASKTWPLISGGDISELIRDNQLDASALSALASSEPRPDGRLLADLAQARKMKAATNPRIAAGLGLP